ncbi:Uncharacterized protein BP5553_01208 [Venustampulla echinocandica]|uniref:Synaptobrevin n=1 Tax=Venustampulla echinocandica TaxID=2656787 RepID=A0A370U0C8_9HELO|nr:Uncharacterized protein BP5553_01208 [Venustampulla echinocandica]RDL41229.1 Uncharacterized protein BP5553_01208 [Venustampulla echinocandica]
MAVATAPVPVPAPAIDPTSINLTRMLARLQQTLIAPSSETESRLRFSSFEREKVGTNIRYANQLLLRLEEEAQNIKIPAKKQETQAELYRKRELILRLEEQLQEFEELGEHETDEDSSEGEDLLGEDTPSEETEESHTQASLPETPSELNQPSPPIPEPRAPPEPQREVQQPTSQAPTEPTSTLRSRNHAHEAERAKLLAPTTSVSTGASTGSSSLNTHTKEALLTHHRTEQESLTNSLLDMASALKASSQSFASSLEDEKDILNRATQGMDKNELGLESATRRMGMLRSMTEGKGWWGRMLMYAWIAGLALLAVLIVFVGPKLRF